MTDGQGDRQPKTPETSGGGVTSRASIFVRNMPEEEQEIFEDASPDIELSDELKLIRTVLATLTDDVQANAKRIGEALVVLLRAVNQQHRQNAGQSDFDALLTELGDNRRRQLEAPPEEVKQLALFEESAAAEKEEK